MKTLCLALLTSLLVVGCVAPPAAPEAQMARYMAGQQALANIQRQNEINAANSAAFSNNWMRMQQQNNQQIQQLPVQPFAPRPSDTFFINSPTGSRTVMRVGNSFYTN